MIVVPMKRSRGGGDAAAPTDENARQYNALEDALRLRGVITLIHDNIFSGSAIPSSSGPSPSPGTSKCRRTEEAGPSSSREGDPGPSGQGRGGGGVLHLNSSNNDGGDPLVDYREYLTRYLREDTSSRRGGGREGGKEGEGGEDSSAEEGGPCCSYVGTPGCSSRAVDAPPWKGGASDDSDEGEEGEEGEPSASPLHFCTIGRARFSGLTVPFFHRVARVTDACIHAVCGGGGDGGGRPAPRPAYDIATLRAEPRSPSDECRLQTLVLRHFPKITDQSLYTLSKLASLRYLDVTGTSVTACGVKNFRLMRPDVEVSSDHDSPLEP